MRTILPTRPAADRSPDAARHHGGRTTASRLPAGTAILRTPAPGDASSELLRSPTAREHVERVIEDRLGSAMLTVANLCRWTGMSRSSLYRLFDADGGVQVFIRRRRLARVAEELRGSASVRMADIAERWGFCDAAYLARVFRESWGVTPSAYRDRYRR